MATHPPKGDNHRNGQVTGRSQVFHPKNDTWVKRDTPTGKFMNQKSADKPFKGIRKKM